jgi:hypothetical protein
MRFASRFCTVARVLCVSFLLSASDAAFGQSVAAAPDYEQISHHAIALVHLGDYVGATALLEPALAEAAHGNAPEWEATIIGMLGSVHEKTGRYMQAERMML